MALFGINVRCLGVYRSQKRCKPSRFIKALNLIPTKIVLTEKTSKAVEQVPSPSLTWNLNMMVSKRNLLFQGLLFRFHVKFQGCKRTFGVHSLKLTAKTPEYRPGPKREFIIQPLIFRGHVSFRVRVLRSMYTFASRDRNGNDS